MVGTHEKANEQTGQNREENKWVFRDGPICIRRWKARKRAERLVERVGRRMPGLAGALLFVLPVAAAQNWIHWLSLSQYYLAVEMLQCVGVMAAFFAPLYDSELKRTVLWRWRIFPTFPWTRCWDTK